MVYSLGKFTNFFFFLFSMWFVHFFVVYLSLHVVLHATKNETVMKFSSCKLSSNFLSTSTTGFIMRISRHF